MKEFDGWTFIDPVSECNRRSDRSKFTKGKGVIAVADSDEFDDKADAKFNSSLKTPIIDISAAAKNTLILKYDSSWRKEHSLVVRRLPIMEESQSYCLI